MKEQRIAHASRGIGNIQILRGFAALAVVAEHASQQFWKTSSFSAIDATQAGVDVFFVISGFIMVYVTSSRTYTAREFIEGRLVRIVPNYWIYTLLTVLMTVLAPHALRGTEGGVRHLLLSLLFVAHKNPALIDSISPLLRVGWTLNYEMFFYLIFAIALMRRVNRVVFASGMLLVLVLAGTFIPSTHIVLRFYTGNIMLEFIYGMVLALIYRNGIPRMPAFMPILASIAALAFMITHADMLGNANAFRSIYFGLPALVIVASGLMLESQVARLNLTLLQKIGDASYSIYLIHPFLVTPTRVLFIKLHHVPHTAVQELLYIVMCCLIAAVFGHMAFRFIELPLNSAAKRVLGLRRPVQITS